jgi:hypothetical protein
MLYNLKDNEFKRSHVLLFYLGKLNGLPGVSDSLVTCTSGDSARLKGKSKVGAYNHNI